MGALFGTTYSSLGWAAAYPFGEAMTTGLGSNGTGTAYLGTNPAMLDAISSKHRGFAVQIANFGVTAEAGKAETLADDFSALNITNATVENLGQTVDDLNGFLGKVGSKAYLNVQAELDLLSPLVYSFQNKGSFGLNINSNVGFNLFLLGGEVSINRANLQNAMVKEVTGQTVTNAELLDVMRMTSSLFIKTKFEVNVALAYANTLFRDKQGALAMGGRLTMHQIALNKGLFPFKQYLTQQMNHSDDPVAYPDTVQKTLLADIKALNNLRLSQQVPTVDFGVAWYADYYDFGLTLKNINQPYVKFPSLGNNCEASLNPANCYFAASLKDQIDLSENFTYSLQPRLEMHAYTKQRTWTLGGYFETLAEDQPLGENTQWAGASIAYHKGMTRENWYYSWLIPSARLGYHRNLTGSQYSYFAVGLNWLGLHLDVLADDSVLDSSKTYPHVLGASLGLNFRF